MGFTRWKRYIMFHSSLTRVLLIMLSGFLILHTIIIHNRLKPIVMSRAEMTTLDGMTSSKPDIISDQFHQDRTNIPIQQRSELLKINQKALYEDTVNLPNGDNTLKVNNSPFGNSIESDNQFTIPEQLHHDKVLNNLWNLSVDHRLHIPQKENKNNTSNNFTSHIKPILIATEIGRLGNKLFQFAASYAIAQQTFHQIAINRYSDLLYLFSSINAIQIDIDNPKFKTSLYEVHEDKAGTYSANVSLKVPKTQDVKLCCYFQSWKYFLKYEKDIRNQLQLNKAITNKTNVFIHKIMSKHLSKIKVFSQSYRAYNVSLLETTRDFTYIGVHVRMADMNFLSSRKNGYISAPLSYIAKAIQYYRKHYTNTVFLVFSDNIIWCKRYISTFHNDTFFIHRKPIDDFAALVSCNHTVITVGTFGWWAGWLAGGSVVYYKGFPKPGTPIGNLYTPMDYYPPHWIPFE